MAAPATWQRTGDPASAFSGLSRGRGFRGRGAHRGRGISRANLPAEDNTPKDISPHPPTQPAVTDKPRSAHKPPRKPSLQQPPGNLPTPTPPKPSNRRRRVSKANGNDFKISPSTSTSSQPLTKDPPPHLQKRHDIDALVERVRAVAMDNRPATPGSHIDWAGDDDDSLPDLNDWGVTTSTVAPGGPDSISPIILEGLKPLPDLSAPAAPSPLRQTMTLDHSPMVVLTNDQSCKPDQDQVPTNTPLPDTSSNEQTCMPSKPVRPSYSSNRKPWHPSLPAKPDTGSLVPRANLRPVATPMRHSVHTKPDIHKESSLPQNTSEQVAAKSTSASPQFVSATTDESVPEAWSTSEDNAHTESAGNTTTDPAPQKDDLEDDSGRDGLEASIHAIPNPTTTPRNHLSYKKESHTRHPPLSRNLHANQPNRLKQWNEGGGRLSPRNQPSSITVGSPNSQHRVHASRPIITGDAMSRLARTIGQTNSAS